ncbi:MAG: 2-oxoacid:ferredoxin oxidoreductase subunit beta [Bacteroidota bacterium]|nr:2-oxoacid:ferredoxin oxidoreductase subunit beta [Bacteroidota bacterium]
MEQKKIKIDELQLTKKDFVSDQVVKWCPGCGDFAVLNSLQGILPKIGKKKEDIVIVSGIGCSSRFPYYMNTYGIHGIHGRAAPIASGVKLSNPNLSVWQITGDGDGMAIGGNHFIHLVRRNIDINVLLFNNKIYGLTKGQASPTSPKGSRTKTSPDGTIEKPFRPGILTLGAQGDFFARILDRNMSKMQNVMLAAEKHKGTSIVEILQNCVIFNNDVHAIVTAKEHEHDNQLWLEDGKPMLFGKEKEKGIIFNTKTLTLEAVKIGENGISIDDILVHDAQMDLPWLHLKLIQMHPPELPLALGVIRSVKSTTYEQLLENQITERKENSKFKNVDDLLNSGDVFEIK